MASSKMCKSRAPPFPKELFREHGLLLYAYGCTHRSDNNKSNCHLFRFPTDEKVRRKWIDLCRYVDLSLICKKYKATPINTRRNFELITKYICHVCNLYILILLLETNQYILQVKIN